MTKPLSIVADSCRRAGLLLACALACVSLRADPPPVVEGGFTLVVIPDSQKYVETRPEFYTLQTGWIAANVARYGIVRVLHVGDITQHDTTTEWAAADRAHRVFTGLVPGIYAQGNHDMALRDEYRSRVSRFSQHITLEDYRRQPGFGGVYDREPTHTQNSFHLFEAGEEKWLVIALEFAPRDDVLDWANEVVARHPERRVILLTHAYLRPDATRYDRTFREPSKPNSSHGLSSKTVGRLEGGFNDGEDMWRKLVSQHANLTLVVCGHVCTSAYRASRGVHGNTVHQVLVDYQNAANGGNGWLRLLQFLPDGRTIRVRDYSPLLNETSAEPSCTFEFQLGSLENMPAERTHLPPSRRLDPAERDVRGFALQAPIPAGKP
ncbi:MAG: metallophosphoesterase [Verrucomicrobiales bacterium]|nr:metallophosphoesterase [Verrucomicrobiales bacterium]